LFLKKALCEAPILAYPLPKGLFVLDTDASNVGIGGVLSQVQDNKEKVIAYGSKKLDKQQQRYSVTRRELLVVITFIHQFRHFLWGRNFLLRTDHGSLKWLFNFKDSQGQLARWLEVLSQYDFEIQHRLGSKHQNADPLSRKDGDHPLCEHQMKGENNVKCDICISMSVLVLNETG
jgi:phospholipid-translocating ATPase